MDERDYRAMNKDAQKQQEPIDVEKLIEDGIGELDLALNVYISLGRNQDECVGFSEGFASGFKSGFRKAQEVYGIIKKEQ